MESRITARSIILFSVIVLGSFGAGTLNGLLGTGGGIILTLIFRRLCPSPKDAFVSAMAAVAPISAVSLMTYGGVGELGLGTLAVLVIPSAAGGLLGAYLSTRVKSETLETVFALLVIYSGGRILLC